MIKKEIETIVKKVLEELNITDVLVEIKPSNRKDLCDYQYDGAFSLAKLLHKSPLEIGNEILEKLQEKQSPMFSKIELLPPGFLNFTLSNEKINEILNKMLTNEKFSIELPEKETVIIDYGGPNIAKPLHVGHLRSAIVGESIKRILKYLGHTVISDVHLGDYGLQIGQVIYGLKKENIKIEHITLEKLEEIYPKISGLCKEDEHTKEICATITKELQDNNKEYQEYFKKIKEISSKDIKRIYDYLDVHFDLWYGESDAYPYIEKLTPILEEKKLLKESEGAKIIEIKKETDTKEIPPLVYQKGNKAYLYGTTDLGTIYERMSHNPTSILYVADKRQALHFESVFRVCEKIGYKKNTKFEFLGFGTVNGNDGKPFKTRAGNSPKLDTLFKEVKDAFLISNEKNETMKESDLDILVNAIIKFADLQNNREKDYIFDIKKFSEVIGKTGPYLLYTYIRIENILKNEQQVEKTLNNKIYNDVDRALRIKLLELNDTLKYTEKQKLPSILANYLYEMCVNMNAFYEKNHINKLSEIEKKENWLIILKLSNKILKEMLDLLSIKIPERM